MALPTFLVIGAQKAATTTLHHWLGQHPDIFLPEVKETNFFVDAGTWHRGVEHYESEFAGAESAPHRGDVSPAYTMFPLFGDAPGRAARIVPDARLVYVIRHPVDRMVSAWAQLVGAGVERRSLAGALLHEAHYSQASMYGLQVTQWLEHFDRSALLILRSDDLTDDPGASLDQLMTHLGLETGWRPPDQATRNTSEGKRMPRRPVRRARQSLRRRGYARAHRMLGPYGRAWPWLSEPIPRESLDPDLTADFTELFRADFARLREVVGPDLDLWGLG